MMEAMRHIQIGSDLSHLHDFVFDENFHGVIISRWRMLHLKDGAMGRGGGMQWVFLAFL